MLPGIQRDASGTKQVKVQNLVLREIDGKL